MGFWSKSSEEVMKFFSSSESGLREDEIKSRIEKYGLNDLPKRRELPFFKLLFSEITNPLILTLIAVSLISWLTGGPYESVIIILIVLINVFVGFTQDFKSEKALQKLTKYITYKTKVLRNKKLTEVDAKQIVPGDIILIETGDRIPADLRLIVADELEIDESLITGESFPVNKISEVIEKEKLLPQEMKNMAFMGTLVVNGKGRGIVVSTGIKSTFGKVVGLIKSEEPQSNYQKNIKNFSELVLKLMIVGLVFIFVINFVTGKGILNTILFSLALALGIIPESLPIIITIGLTSGALKLGKNGVVVKKLAAIEDLGNIDVLCTDKTGTMTENQITLIDYFDVDRKKKDDLVKLAFACTEVIEKDKKLWGNPMDVSIHEYAKKTKLTEKVGKIDVVPFDYQRKRMSVIVKERVGLKMICKGSPESIVSVCTKMRTAKGISKIDREKIKKLSDKFFEQGYRVLAVSTKKIETKKDFSVADEKDLIFDGFLYFSDPPKRAIKTVIDSLKNLGVELKILTGDNELVTKRIAEETGVGVMGVLNGSEIESVKDDQLSELVLKNNIFARLTPELKVRIIKALKKKHVVGFLGDGVNDAPALKSADVGISVENSVDIAKEGADIILTRKSLNSILEGIVEGRKIFSNTTKYILNTLTENIGNVITLALISPFLSFLPMLPAQILLVNLLTDAPLLSISKDKVDEEELKKPKNWNLNFIKSFSIFFGGMSSIFDFVTISFLLFLTGLSFSFSISSIATSTNVTIFQTGWFIESVLSEIFVTFAIRTKKTFYKSRPDKLLITLSLIFSSFAIAMIYFGTFDLFFQFVPLSGVFLALILLIVFFDFAAAEIGKKFFYKRQIS